MDTWFVLALIPSMGLNGENKLIAMSFNLALGSAKSVHTCEKKTK